MKPVPLLLILLAPVPLVAALPDTNKAPENPPVSPGWVFSLLPKSLQKKPLADLNFITEMTAEGRRSPPATPAAPVYFVSKSGGFVQFGAGASTNENPPASERLQKLMEASLARSGYLPATADHPPSLVIIYSWGAHTSMIPENPNNPLAEHDGIPQRMLLKEMVDRARLVGGEKFADELKKAIVEELDLPPNSILPVFIRPVERFRQRSAKHSALFEDSMTSVYFVIASAYDFNALASKSRILLWRTKMTVNSSGLAISESLPSLITAAAPYFGKDMPEVEVLTQRLNREGRVDLGELEVKKYLPATRVTKPDRPVQPPSGKQ